jgi:hypothetical protein
MRPHNKRQVLPLIKYGLPWLRILQLHPTYKPSLILINLAPSLNNPLLLVLITGLVVDRQLTNPIAMERAHYAAAVAGIGDVAGVAVDEDDDGAGAGFLHR